MENVKAIDLSIVMLTGSLSRRAGGLFHSVRYLSQALARHGARVSIVGIRDPDTSADLKYWLPLEPIILDSNGPTQLGYAKGVRDAILSCEPDVVHQHGIWQAFSQETARWAINGPTMISPRGMLDPWALNNSRLKKWVAWNCWEAANLKRACRIHALAQAESDAIKAKLQNSAITIIPNGVSLAVSSSNPRKERSVRELLFLGRIHPKKGLADLLTQWTQLPRDTRSKWRLKIAGPDEGGHRQVLENQIRQNRLGAEVQFVGPLMSQAKEDAFFNADAFILPSYSEGLPMAVLEAWAHKLPVMMTRACNLQEGFDAGAAVEIRTGNDASALLAALTRTDLIEMGRKGRQLVEDRFSWDIIAAKHLKEYQTMMLEFGNM